MADEFEKLLPFMWRGRHLPLLRIHVALAHDLVEHKYWGVDGGRIESTGMAPVRIEAEIPFSNHIFPAKAEKWEAGTLYPTALRGFIVDFAKRTLGIVQHPEFGEMSVKPEKLDFELSGDRQGATIVRASWIESIEVPENDRSAVFEAPTESIQIYAGNLDAAVTNLRALAPQLPEFKEDFESLGRKLRSVVDSVAVLSYREAGVVNRILYQAALLKSSLLRVRDARTWSAIQNTEVLISAAYALRQAFLKPQGIGLYVVKADSTIARLVLDVPGKQKVGDLIRLNPRYMRGPVVPKGAFIRYLIAA